ncbi:MAG TPA: U32 family peptidase [Firmicutes bacterium]|nr:U32 family peptidase [Bacillota bacterium]
MTGLTETQPTVELLAPVGSREVLEAVVAAGADAVYLGGKKHNMRMFRSDLNFDHEGIAAAIAYAHARGVRVYVTLNNLQRDRELPDVLEWARYLASVGPDALIVQDLGVVSLLRREGIALPLHSSVMLNAHNAPMLKALAELGITRSVLGREVSLADARRLHAETGMELEYFIHGDMCIAQSGQCYASGLLFGESSNRGRCRKPCRWEYRLVDEVTGEELAPAPPLPGRYLLALNDMCLFAHLPELIQSGIYSFKIEGRMRTAAYLAPLVAAYRQAIDAYLADPSGYRLDREAWRGLWERRVRDLTTCYALAHPGRTGIGYTGEREPKFFSVAAKEPVLTVADLRESPFAAVLAALAGRPAVASAAALHLGGPGRPHLAVRVGTLGAVRAAAEAGADLIYVGGEEVNPEATPWTLAAVRRAVEAAGSVPVVVAAPRFAMPREVADLEPYLDGLTETGAAGVLAGNYGLLRLAAATGLPLLGDFGLNVMNAEAAAFFADQGVVLVTGQPEASFAHLAELVQASPVPVEALVHGTLPAMVMEYCVPAAVLGDQTAQQPCPVYCGGRRLALEDNLGQRRPLRVDQSCRNHLYLANDLCMLPFLADFVRAGFAGLRIEGQLYDEPTLRRLVALYRGHLDRVLAEPAARLPEDEWNSLVAVSPRPLGWGAYRRGVAD